MISIFKVSPSENLFSVNPLELIGCGDPGIPKNGARTASTFTFPNTVTYSCNIGFQLVGNRRRHCLSTGQWSGALPTCQSKPHL